MLLVNSQQLFPGHPAPSRHLMLSLSLSPSLTLPLSHAHSITHSLTLSSVFSITSRQRGVVQLNDALPHGCSNALHHGHF